MPIEVMTRNHIATLTGFFVNLPQALALRYTGM